MFCITDEYATLAEGDVVVNLMARILNRSGGSWVQEGCWAVLSSTAPTIVDTSSDAASTASGNQENLAIYESQDPSRREILQLLKKAIAVKGGREVLERFRSNKMVSTTTGTINGRKYRMRVTMYLQLPDKMRFDQELSFADGQPTYETFYILGDRAITMAKSGLGIIPRKLTADSESRSRHLLYVLECESLTPLLGSEYHLEKVVAYPTDDHHITAIKVSRMGKLDIVMLFDADSGHLVGVDYDRTMKDGRKVACRTRYSEFREFSGMTYQGVTKYSEGTYIDNVTTIENVEVLDSFPEPAAQ